MPRARKWWTLQIVTWMLLLLGSTSFALGNEQACFGCHVQTVQAWRQSDHAHAMAVANSESVLGNFQQIQANHGDEEALFFRRDGQFFIRLTRSDKAEEYAIVHTFGHFPLQQYLVETEPGRLQALPWAWDSRPEDEGGQRWMYLYEDVEGPADRLHWKQALHNWNGMCADCHSTGLKREYDAAENRFNSHWKSINVGCLSCHQIGSRHPYEPRSAKNEQRRQWLRPATAHVAQLQYKGPAQVELDTCYACHSLRTPLVDGIEPGELFLDQFRPQFLLPPFYHADGQIREEVYVYGSFLQSKMQRAGVVCGDCHEPHSGKLKLEGNSLCTQCHAPERYDTPTHHHHQSGASTQCVSCHMPETNYMRVDLRRDHSFSVPNPIVSQQLGAPLACEGCHSEHDQSWRQRSASWFSPPPPSLVRYGEWMRSGGASLDVKGFLSLLNEPQLDTMKRSSALVQYGFSQLMLDASQLRPFLQSEQGLIRLAAVDALGKYNPGTRIELLTPLLADPLRSVRIAAVQSLLALPLPENAQTHFEAAFKELLVANKQQSWRGEGRASLARIYQQLGENASATMQLQAAIDIDPYYEVGYLNLADQFRRGGDEAAVLETLQLGLQALPESAWLYYSLGLHHVRQGHYKNALAALKRARKLAPDNTQIDYAWTALLREMGENSSP